MNYHALTLAEVGKRELAALAEYARLFPGQPLPDGGMVDPWAHLERLEKAIRAGKPAEEPPEPGEMEPIAR